MTEDRQRQRRTARLQARRAADELLIEAIFGDILLARLVLPADEADAPIAGLPPTTAATLR